MSEVLRVFVGFDPREQDAYQVCRDSIKRHASAPVEVTPIVLEHLRWKGLYQRPHEYREGRLWDVISGAPMSTEFALTRFCTPMLAGWQGLALFCDCDFLFRADVAELFAHAREPMNAGFAVHVVQHDHRPAEGVKMDGQAQTTYKRKNWSSLMLFNCEHPGHRQLKDWGIVNRWPGIRLQQLNWLRSTDIGALPEAWNWLEGSSDPAIEPKAVHFTRGIPSMPGYEDVPYADEWRSYLPVATQEAKCAPASSATV